MKTLLFEAKPQFRLIGLLHGLFGMLGRPGELPEIIKPFLVDLGEYISADGGCLLVAEESDRYHLVAEYGPSFLAERNSELTREVFQCQRPALSEEIDADGSRFFVVGVPLVNDGRLIGGMFFRRDSQTPSFQPSDFPFLGIIALPLAIHIENLEYARVNATRRAELEAVLASMADGLLVLDRNGKVRSFNQTFKDMVGGPADALFGSPWESFFSPQQEPFRLFNESLNRGERFSSKCKTFIARPPDFDGEAVHVALGMNTVVTQRNLVTGGVINIRDVSLDSQMDHLKDEFVATVSHELRTPLTTIHGFLEMMISRPIERKEQLTLLGVMYQETGRLERLINDLLEMSKIQSNRVEMHPRTFRLERLLNQAMRPFRVRHADTHRFSLEIEPPNGRIVADFDRLSQAVTNLIGNAVKYSPEGGEVSLRATREKGEWKIAVSDQGIGVPFKHLEKIFERFFRVNENQTAGSGLGLFITKQIIERHGGRISVESTLGKGTTFRISLGRNEKNSAR
ncbi:MAG TPA: hypothetical protein DD435_09975 [Cyanobacteria bacterium UBA8530]|nr:hypothetical protein [Cyanobacteria bacterium UBA8530]